MTSTQATEDQFENTLLDARNMNAAGEKLLALCTRLAPLKRDLTAFEDAMLGDCCVAGGCPDHVLWTCSAVQSLRVFLKARRYNIVLVLLKRFKSVTSTNVWKDAADILPFAAASCFETEMKWKLEPRRSAPDEMVDVIELLAENGADVKALDNHGNTALFYACMLGHYELFRKLLGKGATISTTHTFVSWRQVTALNLLQVTLEGFVWQEVANSKFRDFPWRGLGDGWSRIASDLFDAGLRSPRADPHILKLLHTACFQGDTSWVERLIGYGVPIDVPTIREQRAGRFYACALHAAVAGGQPPMVQMMLDHGAQPHIKELSTCTTRDRRTMRNAGDDPPRETRKQTALAVAIDETRDQLDILRRGAGDRSSEMRVAKLWETCHMLMEADSLPEDNVQLLELAAQSSHVSLVKRLLQRGYRLAQVPDTKSVEIIQLLIQHGSNFDACQSQRFAMDRMHCGLLNYCFRNWGNLLPSDELGRSVITFISRGDIDMLDVIASSFGVNDFGVKTNNNAKGETLLQIACRSGSKATIDFFLERGANLDLPGKDDNALTILEERFKRRRSGRKHGIWDVWSLVQLLGRHMPAEEKRMREYCKIKAEHLASIQKGTHHDHEESHPVSPNPEAQLRLPMERMERMDGEDFEHTPLSGRDAFRTVILHPATDPAALIECELVPSELCLTTEYEVLSYVWGNNTKPKYIRLEDKVLQVTPNLYEALLALRQQSKPRRLWVDAICINQRDVDERNYQVTIMGDICMNASRVVIWLGSASEDSDLVFQHLARFRQHRDDVMSGRSRPTDPWGESHLNPPRYAGATHAAVQRLLQRPWFFRTWVIQEKALSKKAMIYCGSECASWDEFFRPMSLPMSSILEPIDCALHGLDYKSRAYKLHTLRPSTGYRGVLTYSRDCLVTDPKDRVYGILGLLKPGLIQVKYELDVQEIYRSFAQAVIEDSGSIDLLNLCGTRHIICGLPSWVPDFNARRSSCHFPGLNEGRRGSRSARSRVGREQVENDVTKSLPGPRFRNGGKELVMQGKAVDVVRAVGEEMPASDEYAFGTDEFCRILSGWESLAIDNVPTQTGRTSDHPRNAISDAFLATLVALDTVCVDDRRVSYMPAAGIIWYRQHGTGALMRRERQYFEDVEYCALLSEGYMDDDICRRSFKTSYEWYSREFERAVYGRKLFVTEGGSLGLGEPQMQPGDKIVSLPGSRYPFTIRDFDKEAFTLLGDCYVYGFDVSKLFDDHEKPITEYVFK